MKHYLALDLGASSGRAIIGTLGDNGKTLSLQEIHRFPNGPVTADGGLRWDINRLFEEIKTGIRKAAATGLEISALGIDTWGVDVCYLGRDGRLIGLPWHYRDERTLGAQEWFFKRLPREQVYAETGIQFMDLNTVYQLAASVRDDEAALKLADKLLFIPNALTYLLCGDVSAEYSIATTSQCYNPTTRQWSDKIIAALGIPRSLFPEVKPSGTQAGVISPALQKELGCGPIPVIMVGSHDTASAVAAVPATDPSDSDWAYLSSGTWSLMGVELPQPLVTAEAAAANYTNEGGVGGKIRFLKNLVGMWLIQECRNQWIREGRELSWSQIAQLAAEARPFLAVINPNDHLFNAPGDMPTRVRQFCRESGQAVPESDGEVARVILESLALAYRHVWKELETLRGGRRLKRLHIVGGGCRNTLLNQLTADAIGAPVLTGPMEATAVGNILVQAIATGAVRDLPQAREISLACAEQEEIRPSGSDEAAWDQAYQRFLKLL